MRDIAHLLNIAIEIEVLLILARIIVSWIPDIDPHHPAMRFLRAAVDPVLAPFRRLLPTFSGIDVSPVLAILVLRAVGSAFDAYSNSIAVDVVQLVAYIVEQVLLAVVAIMAIIVFVRLVISFLRADPWHPTVRLVRDMSRPLVEPFGRILPRTRSIDTAAVSALIVLVAAYVVIQYVMDRLIVRV